MRRATSEPRWGRKSISIFLLGATSFLFYPFCWQFIFFFISFFGNTPYCLALLLAINFLIYFLRWQSKSFLFVLFWNLFFLQSIHTIYISQYTHCDNCVVSGRQYLVWGFTQVVFFPRWAQILPFDIEQRLNREAIMWTLQVEYRTVRIDPNTTAFEVFFMLHNNCICCLFYWLPTSR